MITFYKLILEDDPAFVGPIQPMEDKTFTSAADVVSNVTDLPRQVTLLKQLHDTGSARLGLSTDSIGDRISSWWNHANPPTEAELARQQEVLSRGGDPHRQTVENNVLVPHKEGIKSVNERDQLAAAISNKAAKQTAETYNQNYGKNTMGDYAKMAGIGALGAGGLLLANKAKKDYREFQNFRNRG